jgi:hypothetical protein
VAKAIAAGTMVVHDGDGDGDAGGGGGCGTMVVNSGEGTAGPGWRPPVEKAPS